MAQVEITVRSQLNKVIAELERIKAKAAETGSSFGDASKGVEEGIQKNMKRTERFLGSVGSVGRRIADQLRRDFKSLLSLNALSDSMKISNKFRDAVAQTVELSDSIRRLGPVFNIAQKDFVGFQEKLTTGLGDIGLSADVAARTLLGLSKTPVRGQDNILNYSKNAGMLASVGGEKGQEGEIAKEMAYVIQARGGDVNDKKQQDSLSESLRRVFNATGATPGQVLSEMKRVFEMMPEDLRKSIDDSGLANLAAGSAVGGPNSMQFFQEYFNKSSLERRPIDDQGGRGLIGNNGIDLKKLKSFLDGIKGRINSDPRAALKTLGISDQAAEGLVRLSENADKVREKQDQMAKATGDLATQFDNTKSLMDAFTSNLNRAGKELSSITAPFTQKLTELLVQTSKSDKGASMVTAGAAVGGAALAGFALSNIIGKIGGPIGKILGAGGSSLLSMAQDKGAEAILGENTIPVWVVNANQIGGGMGGVGGGLAAAAGSAGMGLLGSAGLVALGGIIAYQLADAGLKQTETTDEHGFTGDWLMRLFKAFNGVVSGDDSYDSEMEQRDAANADDLERRKPKHKETTIERLTRWRDEDKGAKDEKGNTRVPSPSERERYKHDVHITVESKDPKLKVTAKKKPPPASQ